MALRLTEKQVEARKVLGSDAANILLVGGSRSGKTFLAVRIIVVRALAAAGSRHAILRFRFNHCKASIVLDTFPKVMELCFPQIKYTLNKTDFYAEFPNGAQIWFGGLDEKERTEKILGQEHITIYLNEASQIPYSGYSYAMTRLAQAVTHTVKGKKIFMRRKLIVDCNPPSQAHWTYQLFIQKRDPESKQPLIDPESYAWIQMNPEDNVENLPEGYLNSLQALPPRLRIRFLEGKFAAVTENALWDLETIEKWRQVGDVPDMQRVVVAVDPSGGDGQSGHDAVGIVVAGLGVDGNGYLLEDCTVAAGPVVWGRVVATAYDRHQADWVVAEKNFGGAMVEHVVQTARPRTPYKSVVASRGKAVRAEPVSVLTEQGRIRHVGFFPALEDELCAFSTHGYLGDKSPNRADAYVWAFTELFGAIVQPRKPVMDYTPYYEPLDAVVGM